MDTIPDKFTVIFHNIDRSDAVETRAKEMLSKLTQFNHAIMYGSMTIEQPHRHHHQGNVYRVSIRLHLPGEDVIVSREPEINHAHEDVYVAMRDACRALERQLQDRSRRQRVKTQIHKTERLENQPLRKHPPEEREELG
jgi:ribosome-associated translation inhibitor RaiA